MKIIIRVALILAIFGLAGCSHQFDAAYLVKHPQYFKAILAHCESMTADQQQHNRQCLFAIYVYQNYVQMIRNPEAFGKQILDAQITREQLKDKINGIKQELSNKPLQTAKQEQLQNKLLELQQQEFILQQQLDVMVKVVGAAEGM